MSVEWDEQRYRYVAKEKLSNGQTLMIVLSQHDWSDTTIQWNICLSVFSKRKHAGLNERHKIITGKNPFENVAVGMRLFKQVEARLLAGFAYRDNIIFCTWTDNRRRDAYYKILHRWGYDYGVIDKEKVIMKKFPKTKEGVSVND